MWIMGFKAFTCIAGLGRSWKEPAYGNLRVLTSSQVCSSWVGLTAHQWRLCRTRTASFRPLSPVPCLCSPHPASPSILFAVESSPLYRNELQVQTVKMLGMPGSPEALVVCSHTVWRQPEIEMGLQRKQAPDIFGVAPLIRLHIAFTSAFGYCSIGILEYYKCAWGGVTDQFYLCNI